MKFAFLCLIAACGLALSSHAQSFRITAEFLYPNNSSRPVMTLPNLVVTPGTTSDAKYSSRDEGLNITRDHTVLATLAEAKDDSYELTFEYDEWTTDTRKNEVRYFSFHTRPTLRVGIDVVMPADILNPAKGVFRIKIKPITP
jgi:hypothetical protein